MVTCPLCLEPAAVRKNKNNKFYFISAAGLITPSSDFGQAWFMEHAEIWGEDGTPAESAPDWIRENRSNPDNTTSRGAPSAPPAEFTAPQAAETADAGELDEVVEPPADAGDDDKPGFGRFLGLG